MTQVTYKFRTDPTNAFHEGVTVDRENGILRGLRVMEPGMAKGHGIALDDVTMTTLARLGSSGGRKSRFGHPGMSNTALGTYLGTVENIRLKADYVVGDLHLDKQVASVSPNGNLYEYILNLAENAPTQAGASIVCEGELVWKGSDGVEYEYDNKPDPSLLALDAPFLRPLTLDAVDIVDEPAATSGMFSSNIAFNSDVLDGRDPALAEQMFQQLDTWLSKIRMPPEKAWEFANRYFGSRTSGRNHIPVQLNGQQLKTVMEDNMSLLNNGNDGVAPDADMFVENEGGATTIELGEGQQEQVDYFELLTEAVFSLDAKIVQLQELVESYDITLAEMQGEIARLEMQLNAEPEVTLELSTAPKLPTSQAAKLANIVGRSKTLGNVKRVGTTELVEQDKKNTAFSKQARPPKAQSVNPVSLLRTAMGQSNHVEVL